MQKDGEVETAFRMIVLTLLYYALLYEDSF